MPVGLAMQAEENREKAILPDYEKEGGIQYLAGVFSNIDQLKNVGVTIPQTIVLYGPDASGKTDRIQQLISLLPSAQIENVFGLEVLKYIINRQDPKKLPTIKPLLEKINLHLTSIAEKSIESSCGVLVFHAMSTILPIIHKATFTNTDLFTELIKQKQQEFTQKGKHLIVFFEWGIRFDKATHTWLRTRFDKVIKVELPNNNQRILLLEKLTAQIQPPLAKEVKIRTIAGNLKDCNIIQMKKILNEAKILAILERSKTVTQEHMNKAINGFFNDGDTEKKNSEYGMHS